MIHFLGKWRVFSVASRLVWNSLPYYPRDPDVGKKKFRQHPKTTLFPAYWCIQRVRRSRKVRCINNTLSQITRCPAVAKRKRSISTRCAKMTLSYKMLVFTPVAVDSWQVLMEKSVASESENSTALFFLIPRPECCCYCYKSRHNFVARTCIISSRVMPCVNFSVDPCAYGNPGSILSFDAFLSFLSSVGWANSIAIYNRSKVCIYVSVCPSVHVYASLCVCVCAC